MMILLTVTSATYAHLLIDRGQRVSGAIMTTAECRELGSCPLLK